MFNSKKRKKRFTWFLKIRKSLLKLFEGWFIFANASSFNEDWCFVQNGGVQIYKCQHFKESSRGCLGEPFLKVS